MVTKTKIENDPAAKYETIVSHVGMAVVALATILNMTELAHREGHLMAATLQPAYSTVVHTENISEAVQAAEMRRSGREEIRHSSATFGAMTRSHATSGKL